MTIRTQAGLQSQVDTLIDSDGTPKISAEDLRSVLTDLVDSVELHGLGGVDVRVVWSADRAITAAELATGFSFTSNSFNVPANIRLRLPGDLARGRERRRPDRDRVRRPAAARRLRRRWNRPDHDE